MQRPAYPMNYFAASWPEVAKGRANLSLLAYRMDILCSKLCVRAWKDFRVLTGGWRRTCRGELGQDIQRVGDSILASSTGMDDRTKLILEVRSCTITDRLGNAMRWRSCTYIWQYEWHVCPAEMGKGRGKYRGQAGLSILTGLSVCMHEKF